MTREEFDHLDSNGKVACPDCGSRATHPAGGCQCPDKEPPYVGTRHINRYHHTCDGFSEAHPNFGDVR